MADFLLSSDPKSVSPAQYRKILREYIEERLFTELESLVLRYSGPSEHLAFEIICCDLLDYDPSLCFNVIHYPKLLLPIFDEALLEAQTNLCGHPSFKARHQRKGAAKPNCHIRVVSLPPTEYLNKPTISDIRADDMDFLIQISGKVVRTGAVRMLEVSKKYECQNPRCQYRFTVLADPEQDNMLPQPRSCPSPSSDTAGDSGKKCTSTNLRELEGHRVCVDYQELKIQDSFDRVSLGSIPRSIIVILEADLVDKFNAGDDVIIVGVLVRQWKPVYKKSRCNVDIALRANSMQALNAQDRQRVVTSETVSQFESFWQPFRDSDQCLIGRDIIIRSICPQLYGLFYVKLALLLTLVGGSATVSDRGVKRRSQSHLLVVGDPGCGKSQILRFAAAVVARSVLTTGIGTSGAGLTCTAVRDGSDWSLEAGALVLANDGVCCIDEFASIKDQDRVTIHEAMEQQSISVAKAGLVVKLNTRATVLACCNPKGTYDVTADISTNTAIASPLLSRFDLVLVLLDSPEKEWDKRVSTFLLQQAVNAGVKIIRNSAGQSSGGMESSLGKDKGGTGKGKGEMSGEEKWELFRLRDYIAYVKHAFQPVMSKEAQLVLMRYYQMQRQSEERSQGRTTVRLLESLMRLSEAHAKVMSRSTVLMEDAVVAITCVNLSQEQTSLLDANSTLHSDFPPDPQLLYAEQERKIFALLHCTKQTISREAAHGQADTVVTHAGDKENGSGLLPTDRAERVSTNGSEDRAGIDSGGGGGYDLSGAHEVFEAHTAAAFSNHQDADTRHIPILTDMHPPESTPSTSSSSGQPQREPYGMTHSDSTAIPDFNRQRNQTLHSNQIPHTQENSSHNNVSISNSHFGDHRGGYSSMNNSEQLKISGMTNGVMNDRIAESVQIRCYGDSVHGSDDIACGNEGSPTNRTHRSRVHSLVGAAGMTAVAEASVSLATRQRDSRHSWFTDMARDRDPLSVRRYDPRSSSESCRGTGSDRDRDRDAAVKSGFPLSNGSATIRNTNTSARRDHQWSHDDDLWGSVLALDPDPFSNVHPRNQPQPHPTIKSTPSTQLYNMVRGAGAVDGVGMNTVRSMTSPRQASESRPQYPTQLVAVSQSGYDSNHRQQSRQSQPQPAVPREIKGVSVSRGQHSNLDPHRSLPQLPTGSHRAPSLSQSPSVSTSVSTSVSVSPATRKRYRISDVDNVPAKSATSYDRARGNHAASQRCVGVAEHCDDDRGQTVDTQSTSRGEGGHNMHSTTHGHAPASESGGGADSIDSKDPNRFVTGQRASQDIYPDECSGASDSASLWGETQSFYQSKVPPVARSIFPSQSTLLNNSAVTATAAAMSSQPFGADCEEEEW